ncbi:hypothetical protein EV183_002834 [Coemansia sp. RSA 2336]|nr:hypothetical protein EV183_002834 [Coemansia sp. RSA 2336]
MDPSAPSASCRWPADNTGKESIKRLLSADKPTAAIAEFRAANGLEIPAAGAAYALLDSLGYERRSVHEAVLAAAINAAQRRFQSEQLSKDQYVALLDRIRSYIHTPHLQQLALQFLAIEPSLIPEDICQQICASAHLYERCSIGIKRVLWNQNASLFRQHILPLIHSYRNNRDLLYMSCEVAGGSAREFTVRRRKNRALLELSAAIGGDLRLYMQALGMIRDLFVELNDPALGTLRLDLVMVMHENDTGKLASDDICYGLAWPLDACIIKQHMDEHQVQELQSYFDKFDNESVPYGEISLILSSPYTRNILAQYVLSILQEIASVSAVSQRYKELNFPRAMLTMGLSARDLIQQDHPKLPKDSQLRTRAFFQSLLEHIENSSKLPTEEDIAILSANGIARQIIYAFVLKYATDQHSNVASTWLPVIRDIVPAILGIAGADSQDTVEAMQLPLLRLLIRVGRLRHHGHEQTISFLVGCSKLLASEHESVGSSAFSKETAARFIFQVCEYAAAHCAIDPARIGALEEQYNTLASASPRQAFKYRISRCNCPNASKFLAL